MLIIILAALLAASITTAAPLEMVLVEPETVTPATVAKWKEERFKAVAVVLDDDATEAVYRAAARHVAKGALDLYWWIEVARNAKLATAHPRWMAALGSHEDWQKRFPNTPEPAAGEVAKAYPWVPIVYRDAFDAHLKRIEQLLKRAPNGARGLLLNDLQAGPGSCGCGNVLCRWAIDYHVTPTATRLEGDFTAARFLEEVRKRAGKHSVIPVWTTECEAVDLPPSKQQGKPGTGLCGTVPCATGGCPQAFASQWSALISNNEGPISLLAVHTALQRMQKEFGGGPQWVTNAIAYVNQTVEAHKGKTIAPERLWVIVEESAREIAAKAGVGAVIVSRARIEQSYEPRIISTK